MFRLSLLLLRTLVALNLAFAIAFALLLVLSIPFAGEAAEKIMRGMRTAQPSAVMAIGRTVLLIGIGAAAAAHVLLTRLLAIVDTVAAGDPFVLDNAKRLQAIAWALLALQLLDLAFGAMDWRLTQLTGERLGWTLSLTGWIAVVMTFVLARVFAAGAAMRDEIADTV